MKRTDIQSILTSASLPEAMTIPPPICRPNKTAETKTQDSLLCIVAALAKMAKVDPNTPGVARMISEKISELGATLGEDTVKAFLDKIADSLARRQVDK
jgi:hypothetical protein